MNGVLRPDLGTLLGVGVIAFLSVWLIDRGLRAAGKPSWTTSGS